MSFGPAAGDLQRAKKIGAKNYIEEQLHPGGIKIPETLDDQLKELDVLSEPLKDISDDYDPRTGFLGMKLSEEDKKDARQKAQIIEQQMRQAKLLRAIYSPQQLQEVMTDFWFNHFNVFDEKDNDRIYIATYERDAIRPYALGHFRQLLEATAKHPAMLVYLDNWLNSAPKAPDSKGRFKGINENYAREIMELHTMGVNGGYTQADVTTLAQIFTGWGLGVSKDRQDEPYFYFNSKRHDYSDKIFLGHQIHGSGMDEGELALDILATEPATAHHISYQLAEYFIADNPPESLVNAMAKTFTDSDGDIREVLRTMFYSKEFSEPKYYNNKFKTPFHFMVSTLRVVNLPVNDYKALAGLLNQLGEPMYHYLTPNGYSRTNEIWLNSDALLKRIDFVRNVVNGRFAKDEDHTDNVPPPEPDALINAIGAANFSPGSKQAFDDTKDKKVKAALVLSSPELLYY